jgi:urea transport system permease protein
MSIIVRMNILLILCWLSATAWASDLTQEPDLAGLTLELATTSDYSRKGEIVDQLQTLGDERSIPILDALYKGTLYLTKAEQKPVIGVTTEEGVAIHDVLTNENLGVVGVRSLSKIAINNSMRGKLRSAIAGVQLSAKNPNLRTQSARDLAKKPDPNLRDLVVKALDKESISSIKKELAMALAMIDVQSDDLALRKNAIEILEASYSSEALGLLTNLAEKNEDGTFKETNQEMQE